MRFNYFMLALGCCLLSSCGDKTANSPTASADLSPPATTTAPVAATSAPATNTAINTTVVSAATTPVIADAPAIAGSGCSAGSSQLEFQPKQDSFKLTLAELEVGTAQGQKSNVTCNFAIPVTVPAGYQVSILPLHFAGNLVGSGLKIELRREYFFAGTTGTPQVSPFALPANSQFELSDPINNDDSLQWSLCGQDTNIRLNLRLLIKGGEGQAKIKLSSTDTAQPDLFKLNYRACN
jgi:hypothetical protein